MFANKQDVKNSMSASQISDALKLTSLKDRQWHIQVDYHDVLWKPLNGLSRPVAL